MVERPGTEFRRDRLTWVAYVMLAWFAYLQAAPGLVIVHLRDELDLSYSAGGLHVAAFAAGSMVAGRVAARLERTLGRRTLFWSAAALMGAGAIGLTAGRVAAVTVGSVLVMGVGGGLLLVTIQAVLADRHGERRAVALTEANVAASVAYVVLIGVLSLTAALNAGWRVALLVSLVVPALTWWRNRRLAIDAPPPSRAAQGRLPGVFWIAAAMLFCMIAAEWCITAWGASFVEDAADVSTDTAVALMAGYFGGVVVGRTARQPAGAPARSGAAARARARRDRRGVRGPVAVDGARPGAGRPVPARARARQPVPDGAVRHGRARAGAVGAGERTGGVDDVVRGAARAPHGRDARGRDVADGRVRGPAGRPRAGGGGARARASSASAARPATRAVPAPAERARVPGFGGPPRRSRCSDRSTALCGPPARDRKEWGEPRHLED